VSSIFGEHKRRYGARRIQAELRSRGKRVGRHRIRKVMIAEGLSAIQPRSFVPKTTQSPRELAACANLVSQLKSVDRPNQVWVGDITYIVLSGGKFAYLASWKDACSRQVKGCSLAMSMPDSLIIDAFEQAVRRYNPGAGLIVHSDRAGQYFSKKFRALLSENGCQQSMAGIDNPYENAMAESFWSRLKAELLEGGVFETFEEAQVEIFEYIEGYYNTQRRHSGIGYLTPQEFEVRYYQEKQQTI
jgi:transposase InsO family protein